jgi:hypothetical protein
VQGVSIQRYGLVATVDLCEVEFPRVLRSFCSALRYWIFFRRRGSALAEILAGPRQRRNPFEVTIRFVPVSAPPDMLEADWAEDCHKIILRRRCYLWGRSRRNRWSVKFPNRAAYYFLRTASFTSCQRDTVL